MLRSLAEQRLSRPGVSGDAAWVWFPFQYEDVEAVIGDARNVGPVAIPDVLAFELVGRATRRVGDIHSCALRSTSDMSGRVALARRRTARSSAQACQRESRPASPTHADGHDRPRDRRHVSELVAPVWQRIFGAGSTTE